MQTERSIVTFPGVHWFEKGKATELVVTVGLPRQAVRSCEVNIVETSLVFTAISKLNIDGRSQGTMPPRSLPPLPSAPTHNPGSFHPIDNRSPRDPFADPGAGDRRPRGQTRDDKKRVRSNSTPPDSRFIHPGPQPQRPNYPPVSANTSRTWAMMRGSSTGNVAVDLNVQAQGLIQMGTKTATQFLGNFGGLRRRNSDIHPGRPSISSPVETPVIPRASISDGRPPPNRLRKNSYQRPRILFYHKHEPHYGFTNFSTHPVVYQGRRYPTSEHLFQSLKVWETHLRTSR